MRLRVEQLDGSEGQAAESARSLNNLWSLLRTLGMSREGGGPQALSSEPLAQTFESVVIEQHGPRVRLSASVPLDALRRLTAPAAAPAQP